MLGIEAIPLFQLLQFKHGIRLEQRLKESGLSGKAFRRSLRLHAAKRIGLDGRPKHQVVIDAIQAELDRREKDGRRD